MRNGSGVMSVPYPSFQSGQVISSTQVNANNTDIVAELTNSIAADGQTPPTANLPMGGFKHTGLGAGSAATDSAHLGQVQAQAYIWCGTAGGTADALTLSPSPAITAYAAGQCFRFIAGATPNTGAATVAVSGLTTKAIQNDGAALAASDIAASKLYEVVYDGTAFQLLKIAPVTQATRASLGLATSDSPQFTAVNIGHASDTTVARASAGVISVEGNHVPSPASQAQGDVLYHNGTTWARLAAGTSGQFLKTNGAGADPAWASASGKIVQVQTVTLDTTFSSASTSMTDITGLAVNITPTSASNTILVMASIAISQEGGGAIMVRLVRDSTPIFVGASPSNRTQGNTTWANGTTGALLAVGISGVDSPATTSAVTYKAQMKVTGGTGCINRSQTDTDNASFARAASTITVMEIAA